MNRDARRRIRAEIQHLGRQDLDWVTFATASTEALRPVMSFEAICWHTVDPGTMLFTGSVNRNVGCSGSWLARTEYMNEDVNKWSFLATSGQRAGATSIATHGDLSRSARHRDHADYGFGDELRGSFVADGTYWGAVGMLRAEDDPSFTEDDVRLRASLSEPLAEGLRRGLVAAPRAEEEESSVTPGVVVFDEDGNAESITAAAEHLIEQIVEIPSPASATDSKAVRSVAARARALRPGQDPLDVGARSRVRTRSGSWLVLYGSRLSGGAEGRTAVILQPAAPSEVAQLVALAYGLTDRERQIARLCVQGLSTKEMAKTLHLSAYTVQDHLKSIFEKTGTRSRGELVGQVFLEHYVPRWEDLEGAPAGWLVKGINPPTPVGS